MPPHRADAAGAAAPNASPSPWAMATTTTHPHARLTPLCACYRPLTVEIFGSWDPTGTISCCLARLRISCLAVVAQV